MIRITDEYLWTRQGGTKKWVSIICIRLRYETGNNYLDIYMSNDLVADEEFNLAGTDVSVWRIKRILKRHAKVENH
jgi:hypothetical protein